MSRIKKPQKLATDPWSIIIADHKDNVGEYVQHSHAVDSSGKYLSYHKLAYKLPKHIDADLVWSVIKQLRNLQKTSLFSMGDEGEIGSFLLTPNIQKVLSETDRSTTTAALEWMTSNIGEEHYLKFLLEDLIEDESISSSQLEGAATTTLAAKNLIKKKKKPRTMDEKMILGNFHMMQFAWNNKDQALSIDMIKDLHKIGVDGIDDDKYHPGEFRVAGDDIVVSDSNGEVVHTPPDANNLDDHFSIFVEWVNKCHDEANERDYIHPLIKAIVIHFFIGYEHPFRDGNGRVARSLFYWFMFKNNYAAFRYIAISTILKQSAKAYGLSYIHSEIDDLDLTYFIEHQCKVIDQGISRFKKEYNNAKVSMEEFDKWIWKVGLFKKLSEKERVIFTIAKSKIESSFTAKFVSERLECSYNTAATALNKLYGLGLFRKRKYGREYVYRLKPLDIIRESFEFTS